MDIKAAFDEIAPAIEALRRLTALDDFTDGSPELTPSEAQSRLAEAEAVFTPLAAKVNAALPAIAKALNAAEAPPTSFGAKLMQAQKQRTGGAPDALTRLFPETPAADWPTLISQAEARRRAFAHWFSTYEGFRKHTAHRAKQAGG